MGSHRPPSYGIHMPSAAKSTTSDAEPRGLILQPCVDSFVFTTFCLSAFLQFLQGSGKLLISGEDFH